MGAPGTVATLRILNANDVDFFAGGTCACRGLYSYIGDTAGGNDWSLLLALGSSAVGYSAWTVCAIGAVIDAFRSATPPAIPNEPDDAMTSVRPHDCQPTNHDETAVMPATPKRVLHQLSVSLWLFQHDSVRYPTVFLTRRFGMDVEATEACWSQLSGQQLAKGRYHKAADDHGIPSEKILKSCGLQPKSRS